MEQGIGQLKRKFHVLHGEVRVSPEKTCQIITACAVLYNICKIRNIPDLEEEREDDEEEEEEDGEDGENEDEGEPPNHPAPIPEGVLYRAHFTNLHFA